MRSHSHNWPIHCAQTNPRASSHICEHIEDAFSTKSARDEALPTPLLHTWIHSSGGWGPNVVSCKFNTKRKGARKTTMLQTCVATTSTPHEQHRFLVNADVSLDNSVGLRNLQRNRPCCHLVIWDAEGAFVGHFTKSRQKKVAWGVIKKPLHKMFFVCVLCKTQ